MTTEQKVTRKLRAILSADVKGYSLLMTNDEASTIKTLKEYRVIMTGIIKQHSGRVVDAPGDNVLAEFSSVVNAVQCSVEIQKALKTRNEDLPDDKRLEFRIGVNIGDVVQDGDSLYGEGVNIAARIEGLADPGGVCISRGAYDHIRNKLGFGYEYLGDHTVKNIKQPVRVYKILMAKEDAGKLISEAPKSIKKSWAWPTIAAVAIILILIGYQLFQKMTAPEFETASIEKMAFPLPDKTSIAVLPFENLSKDPEQEYFSDGITEEIITALSKTPKMLVIARNSTFNYKGKPVKVHKVAEDLGVQYVVTGSVRQSGDRLRITTQLIDAITGHHLWAERYDRGLENIFSLQDEITIKIISALQLNLTEGEVARISATRTKNLEAYLKILKAREYYLRLNKDGNTLAQRLIQEVIALDPEYPYPYAILGWTHYMDVWYRTSNSPKQSMSRAFELAQKALSLDSSTVNAYPLLAYLYTFKKEYEKGIAEAKRILEINPNWADGHCHHARILHYIGKHEESIELYRKAMRLNPFPPSWYYYQLGYAYMMMGQYEDAITEFKKSIKLQPNNQPAFVGLAAVYGLSGKKEEARVAVEKVFRINPKFSVKDWVKKCPYKTEADKQRMENGLRKARSK